MIIGLNSDVENIIQEAEKNGIICGFQTSWNRIYVIDEDWKRWLSMNTDDIARRNIKFNILELVMKAFPTPHTEILWLEIEEQLMDVVQTTCVPFLSILNMDDVMDYLSDRNIDKIKKTQYISTLTKFLLRLSTLVVDSTAAKFDLLISCCFDYLTEWPGVKSLYLARAITNERIENLNHYSMKYLNGVIGLGLASISTNETSSSAEYNHGIYWRPLKTSNALSTIEVLAQAGFYGAASLAKASGVIWEDLSLTTRVLIAFSEVRLKSFMSARDILESTFTELKDTYGFPSIEVFLVGTTLVNCLNRCGQEAQAENLAVSICEAGVSGLDMVTTAQKLIDKLSIITSHYNNSDLAMAIAYADSLLGQGKYDVAVPLCQAVFRRGRPGCEDIEMSAALRVAKAARRLGSENSSDSVQDFENIDAWQVLSDISEVYSTVSSLHKYAYVEEVICHLSFLEHAHTRQRLAASEVIKVLTRERPTYDGPAASRSNFLENLQTINEYGEKLEVLRLGEGSIDPL